MGTRKQGNLTSNLQNLRPWVPGLCRLPAGLTDTQQLSPVCVNHGRFFYPSDWSSRRSTLPHERASSEITLYLGLCRGGGQASNRPGCGERRGLSFRSQSAPPLSLRPSGETQQHGARMGPPGPASRPNLPLATAFCHLTCDLHSLPMGNHCPQCQMIPTV